MSDGSGLTAFSKKYPTRFYDVGIAEQHAVTFAAGLAIHGYKPVVAIYSTFMQRAYDQIIHDVALQKIPMLFAIDRAGLVGADGATHTGNFDVSFIRCIPNTVIMHPSNEMELKLMLSAGYGSNNVCFVRYPRGFAYDIKNQKNINIGKAQTIRQGKKLAYLCFGPLINQILPLAEKYDHTVINMRFSKPLDHAMINKTAKEHEFIVTLEDNVIAGGAGSAVLENLSANHLKNKTLLLGFPDYFPEHGSQDEILKSYQLDIESIENKIVNLIS